MAYTSLKAFAAAICPNQYPTITFEFEGNSIPQSALSRSPGGSFEAHPEPATVSVRRSPFLSVIVFSFFTSI